MYYIIQTMGKQEVEERKKKLKSNWNSLQGSYVSLWTLRK